MRQRSLALRGVAIALFVALTSGCTTDAINVETGALAEEVNYLWLASTRDGEKTVFSPLDEKVVLSLRFGYNYRASYEWYKVEWLAPGGVPYRVVSTRTEFGSHRDLRAELAIRGKRAAALPGLWKVRVSHLGREGEPDRELISRLFRIEVMTPEMKAEALIDAPPPGDRPLAGDLPPDALPAGLSDPAPAGSAPSPEGAPPVPATEPEAVAGPAPLPAEDGVRVTGPPPAPEPEAAPVASSVTAAAGTSAPGPAPAAAPPVPVLPSPADPVTATDDGWPGCPPLYYPPGPGCVEEAPEE